MRRQTLLCLKSLGACSALWAAACGTHDSPALSGPDAIPAPRRIELPANIRPLLQADLRENDDLVGGSVPAQYEQPQTPATPRPRITGVSGATPPSSPSTNSVRESYWGNPRANAASSSVMPRGDIVPSPATRGAELGAPSGSIPYPNLSTKATPQPSAVRPPIAPNSGITSAPPSQQRTASVPTTQQAPSPIQQPPPPPQQLPSSVQPSAAMNAVAQQAIQMADQAATMARRGMLFSANTELTKGLTLISQALDVQQGTAAHVAALTAGLTALEEARDFADARNQKGGATDVAVIARNHQTKLTAPLNPGTSPIIAQQQYFGFAQQQLEFAGGGLRASSEILFRLGRLQTAMATHDNDPEALHAPQAIVFHQAALATDANNWLAANELGVLYARYGQLPQARQLLAQSVMIHPHRQGWHNLSVVHRRLGENDLAQRAEAEVQLLDKQQGDPAANEAVRWVDPKTFAASSGGGDANWPASVAASPATNSGTTRR